MLGHYNNKSIAMSSKLNFGDKVPRRYSLCCSDDISSPHATTRSSPRGGNPNFPPPLNVHQATSPARPVYSPEMSSPSRRLQTKPVIACLKTFLVAYSFIFWFTGVILLAVGVWGKVTLESNLLLASELSTNAPYVLISTGAIIVIFGLFGCFATCRGSPWMLKMYAMFLALVFLAELVAGVSGFVFRHEIKAVLKDVYWNAEKTYNTTDDRNQAVDSMQKSLKCCGVYNYTSWAQTEYFKQHGIPTSCCKLLANCTTENLKDLSLARTVVYQQGCFSLVTTVMESNLGIIAGISFGISFFQVIGVFLAFCLARYITNNQYELV